MGNLVPTSVSELVFAVIVALLLFGVFFNRAVRLRIQSRWRDRNLHPFGPNEASESAADPANPAPPRSHVKRHASRSVAAHVEKKETFSHRSG
jgi:hypothetical protein